MNTQQIGRSGELLVQYKLLKLGIESAPMTTDAGVDLVAFDATTALAITIQVKTNRTAKPGGGMGKLSLSWWIADDCPSQLAAFVDLSTDTAWLLTKRELNDLAQQHSSGRFQLYMYTDTSARPRGPKLAMRTDFDSHLLEKKARSLMTHREERVMAVDEIPTEAE